MGQDTYEVGIKQPSGAMLIKTYSEIDLIRSVGWLKHQNAIGSHLYIRPHGEHNLVLLDDLSRGSVDKLSESGFTPCVLVESSPMNYQAWVRLAVEPISQNIHTQAARLLSVMFDSDINSADWRHFGRLAGFTNTKPEHIDETGNFPFVLLHRGNRSIAAAGASLLERAEKLINVKSVQICAGSSDAPTRSEQEIDTAFCYFQEQLENAFGRNIDWSRSDWMATLFLIDKGYSKDEIHGVLLRRSADLHKRKAGHIDNYLERTIHNALYKRGLEDEPFSASAQ